ncbi:MAG: permease, partial [Turicibacter sp.]
MDIFTVMLWIITLVLLLISFKKDKEKTKLVFKMSKGLAGGMIGGIIGIILLIGFVLTLFPPEMITSYLSGKSQFLSTFMAAGVGSVTLIPAFIAFPLIEELLKSGVSMMVSVAFLTTLTMVGIVTFPLERESFGL